MEIVSLPVGRLVALGVTVLLRTRVRFRRLARYSQKLLELVVLVGEVEVVVVLKTNGFSQFSVSGLLL